MAVHDPLHGGRVHHISPDDPQVRLAGVRRHRIAHERRHIVALGEGLLDELPARAAGRSEHEEFHRLVSLDFPGI